MSAFSVAVIMTDMPVIESFRMSAKVYPVAAKKYFL